MPISDPQAIKFTNEQVRVLAEKARAFKAVVDAMSVDWYAGTNALFPNDATVVNDGIGGTAPRHDTEGVAILTGADVHNLVAGVITAAAELNSQVVSKPCVRPFQAN